MQDAEPFRLKATIEVFDTSGVILAHDSLDVLWKDSRRYRQEINLEPLGGIKQPITQLEADNGSVAWRTGFWNGQWIVPPENFALAVLQPFFLYQRMDQRLSTQPAANGNTGLDCVGTEPVLPEIPADLPIAITTYCMERGNHILRFVEARKGLEIVYKDIQPFGNKFVARTIDFAVNGRVMIRLHVNTLESASEFAAIEQTPPEKAQRLSYHVADIPYESLVLFQGQLLKSMPALFPMPGGDVVMSCHVDMTGQVDSVKVLQSSSPALNPLAMAAAKKWKFRVSYQKTGLLPQNVIVRLQGNGESPVFMSP